MQIKIDLNKASAEASKGGRTNFYIWRDLNHLKDYYRDVISPEEISKIANGIRNGEKLINNRRYQYRKELSEQMNERGLCNLVEIELLTYSDVMDKFFDRSADKN
ncbi:MAG: hypothetical protein JW969_19890 [Spirochaetales bacterium]|nr:hypothetical protein [Spirochaetales bacterium]